MKAPIVPHSYKTEFAIDGKAAGSGELRLDEYLSRMVDLAGRFAVPATRASPRLQFEIALDAVEATRIFLHTAFPGTDIEAPLSHLITALVAVEDGKRPAMFSCFPASSARDTGRILVEIQASACVDILTDGPSGLRRDEAARVVAKALEAGGLRFNSRKGGPAYKQVLEWRKRLRKKPRSGARKAGDIWENEQYHDSVARLRARSAGVADPQNAVARFLDGLLAGAISAAHLNRDEAKG